MNILSVMERQVIFIIFTMGIVGGLGYYIWYRRKRLASVDPMAECNIERHDDVSDQNVEKDSPVTASLQKSNKNIESHRNDEGDVNSAKSENCSENCTASGSVQRKSHRSRAVALYLPQHARTERTNNQPDQPSDLKKKAITKEQPCPPVLPADTNFIVTLKLPLWLVSRFIGKQGCNVKSMTQMCGADFRVMRNPGAECSHTSCNVIGSVKQIEAALNLIRQRFPEVKLPNYPHMKLFHGTRHKPFTKQQQHSQHSICTEIVPTAIPPKPFLATVSHVDSLSSIWVLVFKSSGSCPWLELNEKMNSTYTFASGCSWEFSEETENVISLGQYYAVSVDENAFVRGIVKNILPTRNGCKLYTVFLLDHGNHIDVPGDKLIPLRYTI